MAKTAIAGRSATIAAIRAKGPTPMPETVIRYTTAEPDYDYSYTTHMGVVGFDKHDRPVRKVHIQKGREDHQCARYHSGVRMAVDHVEFAKQVEAGFIRVPGRFEIGADDLAMLRDVLGQAREGVRQERAALSSETSTDDFLRGDIYGRQRTLQETSTILDAVHAILTKAGL
jgi:hypothetical protein